MISTRIPNIFAYGSFDNTIIRVKRNVADAWTTITLTDGVYPTVSYIQAAITSSISAWYTDDTDPALLMQTNTVTDEIYIVLDSTKLAAGGTQMCINLALGDIGTTLGFVTNQSFVADGTYANDSAVNFDAQGVFCDVICSLTPARYINGKSQKVLFSIPLTLMTGLTEYLYPPVGGSQVPMIQYQGNNSINSFTINFKTYEGSEMVWLDGSRCEIIFEIQEEV